MTTVHCNETIKPSYCTVSYQRNYESKNKRKIMIKHCMEARMSAFWENSTRGELGNRESVRVSKTTTIFNESAFAGVLCCRRRWRIKNAVWYFVEKMQAINFYSVGKNVVSNQITAPVDTLYSMQVPYMEGELPLVPGAVALDILSRDPDLECIASPLYRVWATKTHKVDCHVLLFPGKSKNSKANKRKF